MTTTPKRRALAVATAGTVLGLGGLGLIAVPAGAQEAPPELPAISAQRLVESVLDSDVPALQGTVEVENNLGLPPLPGVPSLDFDSATVYHNGKGKARIAVHDGSSEFTIVHTGDVVWTYSSADDSAHKIVLPRRPHETAAEMAAETGITTPAEAAEALLSTASKSSRISVDGTATVAGRSAYVLVLTPEPTEKTLLRAIRVAVDYETRIPLRLSVLVNGTTEPVLRIGFTEIEFGPQPAELFTFSPPENATVTVHEPGEEVVARAERYAGRHTGRGGDVELVGAGWDTVVIAELGGAVLSGPGQPTGPSQGGYDPRALLKRFGQKVSGPFGSGYVIEFNGATALLTEDGRLAVGAVPRQVLVQALDAQ